MALILGFETSTRMCSVALLQDGKVLASRELNDGYSHAEKLTVFAQEIMQEANYTFADLQAVAVSEGPGSYTGLRIGAATAKGLCFGSKMELVAIGTLEAMCYHAALPNIENAWKCPMIDARRMEVYTALFDENNQEQVATKAEIIDENSFAELLNERPVIFFGDGADKCEETLGKHPNAHFVREVFPTATTFAELAAFKFAAAMFEDVAYFEPFYLKDFVAGKPKKLV